MKEEQKNPRGVYEKVRGSGEWWIRYADQNGRIHREKVGPKALAIDAYRKRKTEVREARFFPPQQKKREVIFSEIVKDAVEYSRQHKAPDSYKADRWHSEIVRAWFRERVAAEITAQEIERELAKLAEQGRKPATLNRYRAFLSLAYSLAVRNGKLSVNPARLVRLRKENNARVRFLEEKEETKLRKAIRSVYPNGVAELDLALHTGMRRSEQYKLCWPNVDLKNAIITIPRSKHGESRHIPINSTAGAALEALKARHDGSGYVCLGSRTGRGRDWRRWFEEAVRKAKIVNFRWHDLRHTFASRLVMAGVDLLRVKELLGHKTIAMTVRYAHLAPKHLRAAVDVLTGKPTDTATSTAQTVKEITTKKKVA